MSKAIIYQSTDYGSPGVNLSGNLQNRLKQILVPCLVSGYGDKPGAGWILSHEHSNGFTIGNERGDFYVNFVSNITTPQGGYPAMTAYNIHIYSANSCIDVGEAKIDGANLCSGLFRKGSVEPAGMSRHCISRVIDILVNEVSSLKWSVIADERTFIINASTRSAAGGLLGGFSFSLYAGDIVSYNDIYTPCVIGGDIVAYNMSENNVYGFSRGYSAPLNLNTGLAQEGSVEAHPYYRLFKARPLGDRPALRNIQLVQPVVFQQGWQGLMRGVVLDAQMAEYESWSTYLRCLGFSGNNFEERNTSVFINGDEMCVCVQLGAHFFMSTAEEFW